MSAPGTNCTGGVETSSALNRPVVPVASTSSTTAGGESQVLDKKRLQELVKEVDPNEQLDEDVEELLLHIADDFIEQTVTASCALAKHRRAPAVEVRDVQLVLEKNWNMWIPAVGGATVGSSGDGQETLRPFKKSATSEAHKARMALIRKTLKKY